MSTYSIRTFNEAGLNEFERVIIEMKNGNLKNIPEDLLFSEDFVSPFEPIVNIQKVEFKNKNELIPYLVQQLNLSGNKQLYFNVGLWSWLSAFYFDNICPVDGNGKRKITKNLSKDGWLLPHLPQET